ncbi:hypothetical protein ACFXHA_06840 [Nocardia sp. NPDC059240]|uniref:hypothetical protein n=1 Tax=Nocardia sp. NPDC059240 TaxID=3346786 RepID=UPI0036970634
MTDKVRVEVAGLRSTATELDGVASALDTVKAALDAAMTAGKGCWGNDEYGNQFANGDNGDNGYLKRGSDSLDTVGSIVSRLHVYSGGTHDMANKLEKTDQVNQDGFQT